MKKKIIITLSIVLNAIVCTDAQSQEWTKLHTSIYSIVVEGDFLWIPSDIGLIRLDKTTEETVIYDCSEVNTPNIGGPLYGGILEIDANGNKWIGTQYGLVFYDGGNWVLYDTSNSDICANIIHNLKMDKDGSLWVVASFGSIQAVNCLMKFDRTS